MLNAEPDLWRWMQARLVATSFGMAVLVRLLARL
jgi:hypothetical protein